MHINLIVPFRLLGEVISYQQSKHYDGFTYIRNLLIYRQVYELVGPLYDSVRHCPERLARSWLADAKGVSINLEQTMDQIKQNTT